MIILNIQYAIKHMNVDGKYAIIAKSYTNNIYLLNCNFFLWAIELSWPWSE